jgi:LuxR family maltose regulon positive regulatory protein
MRIRIGKPQKALTLIMKLIERDHAAGRMGRVLDLLVLKFLALDAMEQQDQALHALAEAIEIASPENHIRPFVEDSHKLIPYLRKLPSSPHRDRLLKILDTEARSESAPALSDINLIEPLIEREITILRMMSVGRSNREIGDELYLSVNTIRWYASQIYMKLGVKNRGEAVARARELGIL